MRLGIVGSREIETPWNRVAEALLYFDLMEEVSIINSGGSRGVDSAAVNLAQYYEIPFKEYLPDKSKGIGGLFERNQHIVDNSDAILAVWNGKSKGTVDTLKKARKACVPFYCYGVYETETTYTLYTDGSGTVKSSPGGWAYALINNDTGEFKTNSGSEKYTTNNRMELSAVINGLKDVPWRSSVTVVSDSNYVVKGMNEWILKWKKEGLSKRKNADLWFDLDYYRCFSNVEANWVRGHSGNRFNELCDSLAGNQRKSLLPDKSK